MQRATTSFLCISAATLISLGILLATQNSSAAEPPDAKMMEGTWLPLKAELGGQPMPDNVLKSITLKLGDGKYAVTVGAAPDNGTYSIDPKTNPKSMSVTGTEGPNKGRTFPAIYELEGDTLRICYDLSGQKRPAEFKSIAGTKLYLVTYRRQKE